MRPKRAWFRRVHGGPGGARRERVGGKGVCRQRRAAVGHHKRGRRQVGGQAAVRAAANLAVGGAGLLGRILCSCGSRLATLKIIDFFQLISCSYFKDE